MSREKYHFFLVQITRVVGGPMKEEPTREKGIYIVRQNKSYPSYAKIARVWSNN